MFELVFFVAAVALVLRYLHQLSVGRPARVGGKTSSELSQLLEYADKLYLQRKFLSAEKIYLKILKLDHKSMVAYRRLGLIYSAQKNYDEAIESFQIAAHMDPSTVNFFNLGAAYYENSNHIKALAAFEKGLIFGSTADLHAAIGKTQLKLNNLEEAITAFEKAAEKKATKLNLSHLAESYMQAGRREDAAATYQKILKLDPTDAKARRYAHAPITAS